MNRNTRQRAAIRETLARAGRPLSPAEIHRDADKRVGGMGLATVYRTIKAFLEEGWLESVELPGQPPRYELAGKHHHHHFHCNACGKVFEIGGCPENLRNLVPRGFKVAGHTVLLYGRCRACETKSARSRVT